MTLQARVQSSNKKTQLPRLMRGQRTGAIYLVCKTDSPMRPYKAILLRKSVDNRPSTDIGDDLQYPNLSLFEDFEDKLILENED